MAYTPDRLLQEVTVMRTQQDQLISQKLSLEQEVENLEKRQFTAATPVEKPPTIKSSPPARGKGSRGGRRGGGRPRGGGGGPCANDRLQAMISHALLEDNSTAATKNEGASPKKRSRKTSPKKEPNSAAAAQPHLSGVSLPVQLPLDNNRIHKPSPLPVLEGLLPRHGRKDKKGGSGRERESYSPISRPSSSSSTASAESVRHLEQGARVGSPRLSTTAASMLPTAAPVISSAASNRDTLALSYLMGSAQANSLTNFSSDLYTKLLSGVTPAGGLNGMRKCTQSGEWSTCPSLPILPFLYCLLTLLT